MLFNLKPTLFLALALTAVANPIANPTADEPNTLVTRARKTIKDVDCDGQVFTKKDISDAIKESKNGGAGSYPKTYMNHEGLFNAQNMKEYPLVSGGTYTGGAPGKYRVIMKGNGDYLGSLYHIPGLSNGFKKCSNIEDSPTTTTTTTTTTRATTTATVDATTNNSGSSSGNSSGNSCGSKSSKKSSKKPSTKTGSH